MKKNELYLQRRKIKEIEKCFKQMVTTDPYLPKIKGKIKYIKFVNQLQSIEYI